MIKVLESQEVVAFDLANLPDTCEDILDVLAAEAAPLAVWFDFARAYLSQGDPEAFIAICDQGVKPDVILEVSRACNNYVPCMAYWHYQLISMQFIQVERFFGHTPIYEQIQFYCGMASVSIARGREEKDKARKTEHFGSAAKFLNSAKILNDQEQLVYLGFGLLALAKVHKCALKVSAYLIVGLFC